MNNYGETPKSLKQSVTYRFKEQNFTKSRLSTFLNCDTQKIINKDGEVHEIVQGEYRGYFIPPNWDISEKHGKASKVGIDINKRKVNDDQDNESDSKSSLDEEQPNRIKLCPCCEYVIEKQDINLCATPISFSFLGSGYPLFFNYIKYCILILLSVSLTSGEYNMLSNYLGNYCKPKLDDYDPSKDINSQRNYCLLDYISQFTLANKQHHLVYVKMQDILNCSTIIMIMILLLIFRKTQKEIDIDCDIAEITPSDYTIIVKHIPKHVIKEDIESKLRQFFQRFKCDGGGPVNVTKVNLIYDIHELEKLQTERYGQLIKQKKDDLRRLQQGEYKAPRPLDQEYFRVANVYDEEIRNLEKEIESKEKEIQQGHQYFSGSAFVSFETEDQKHAVLKKATKEWWIEILQAIFEQVKDYKTLEFYDYGEIFVSQAPEPLDVLWTNINHSDDHIKMRRIISFFIQQLLLLSCGLIVYYLVIFQVQVMQEMNKDIQKEQSKSDDTVIVKNDDVSAGDGEDMVASNAKKMITIQYESYSASISLVIVFINSFVIEKVCRKIVKIESYFTQTQYDINLSQKLSLVLFINSAVVTCLIDIFYTKNMFGPGGLIYTMFYFFVANAVISPILNFIDIQRYIKKFLIYYYKRQGDRCLLTQQEANELFEYPIHEIEISYADIMKTMYISLFYSPVVPIGQFISMIGLVFYYWVEKYLLIKRKTVKNQLSMLLSIEMTEYLEYCISIYALSNILFKKSMMGYLSTYMIIGAILGVIYSIMPIQLITEKLFMYQEQNESIDYHQAQSFFISDYDRENPITRRKARQNYFNIQKVDKQEQQVLNKNIIQSKLDTNINNKKSEFIVTSFEVKSLQGSSKKTIL